MSSTFITGIFLNMLEGLLLRILSIRKRNPYLAAQMLSKTSKMSSFLAQEM